MVPMGNTKRQPPDPRKATPGERLIIMVRTMRDVPVEELHFRDYLELCRLLQDTLFYLDEVTKVGWSNVPSARRVVTDLLLRAQRSQLPVGKAYREVGEEPPQRHRPRPVQDDQQDTQQDPDANDR